MTSYRIEASGARRSALSLTKALLLSGAQVVAAGPVGAMVYGKSQRLWTRDPFKRLQQPSFTLLCCATCGAAA